MSERAPVSADTGIFVLGMHRSGTSAITRLIGHLGVHTPPAHDLVGPTDRNPKGYWESESLVAFNERLLRAVGSDMRCPLVLTPGWERDSHLERVRREAPDAVRRVFPTSPWVWKDPRHCLVLPFWRHALELRPLVVLVTRNPLEIASSVRSARPELGKLYALALWERYLRQALAGAAGLPVLVTAYEEVMSNPVAWCDCARSFLESAGMPAHAASAEDVRSFVDQDLRHARSSASDLHADDDVSDSQRELCGTLVALTGAHPDFRPSELGDETATTEALLADRRRTLQAAYEASRKHASAKRSGWWARVRRAARTRTGSIAGHPREGFASAGLTRDERPAVHVLHVGKTGGTALNHVLVEHSANLAYRLVFEGHTGRLADVPEGESFLFLVRDPLTRFVSAFNGRLREDQPRYHYPWREEERAAFSIFSTPDQLARALSSDDPAERKSAERAMRGIGHVNTSYSFWFGDRDAFEARIPNLFFVGLQDRLDEDFELLKAKLGLPQAVRLPADETARHATPDGYDTHLSETAIANLERWYAWDVAFVARCRELAPIVNARGAVSPPERTSASSRELDPMRSRLSDSPAER
jgi:hypothetical protein